MDTELQYLSDLNWAYRASRILQTAAVLEIFTHLNSGPMTCRQLAEACGAKPELLEKLLIACTAMGLVSKQADCYSNSPISASYLVKGKALYQGDIIAHSAGVWDFWDKLPQLVRANPLPSRSEDQRHRDFIFGMHNLAIAGRAQFFVDKIDLSGRKRLIDVGGGLGTYSIFACRKYPQLTAYVFDLPQTAALAQQIIASEGMQDRIAFIAGNWEIDDFGADGDVLLFSNVLHGSGSQAAMKLQKAARAMSSGGLLVIQEFLLNDEKTGPLLAALFNVMVGAYSRAELFDLIEQCGFVQPVLAAVCQDTGASWITARRS